MWGGIIFSGKALQRFKCIRVIYKVVEDVKFPGKKRYVTFEVPNCKNNHENQY